MREDRKPIVYPPTPGPDREPVRTWQDSFTELELKRIQLYREWVENGRASEFEERTREIVSIIAKMADLLDQSRLE